MEKIYIKPEIIIMQMEEQEPLANVVSKVRTDTVASDSEVDKNGLTPEAGSDGNTTSPNEAKDGFFDFEYSFDMDF